MHLTWLPGRFVLPSFSGPFPQPSHIARVMNYPVLFSIWTFIVALSLLVSDFVCASSKVSSPFYSNDRVLCIPSPTLSISLWWLKAGQGSSVGPLVSVQSTYRKLQCSLSPSNDECIGPVQFYFILLIILFYLLRLLSLFFKPKHGLIFHNKR